MRDIKELIYAAVEENAVQFQELVNAQLQVRAYDAIEALRPEVGASMFGEAKECDDEEMEDDEDEDEEDEKKSEKKSEVDEELKGNQHKIDKNKNGKIDAHDFKLLRKEEAQQIAELSKKTVGSYLKKATDDYADRHGEEGQSQGWDDARGDSAWDDSPNEDDREEHEKEREANIKKMGDRNRGINRAIKKLTKEEVKQVNERSREDLISQIKGLKKPAIKHGFDWPTNDSTDKTSTKDLKSFHKSARSVIKQGLKKEEVEELDELSQGLLRKASASAYRKSSAHSGIAAQEKQRVRGAADHVDHEKRAATRLTQANKFRAAADAKNEEVVNEVAMPQNQADWQALITHQIKTAGHPVATDAQFRATHGKDTSKIASQEPPEDKLNYAAAQGGTVKQ